MLFLARFFLVSCLWNFIGINTAVSGTNIPKTRPPNILLVGQHSKSGTGTILVIFEGKWKSICRKGNDKSDKTWSDPEATVACRHLGYRGGWAVQLSDKPMARLREIPIHAVDNFRCVGHENSLDQCYHDRSYDRRGKMGCGSNNYAAVKCFKSFEVQLVGGPKPNAGRVQIKYGNDDWTDVCYNDPKKRKDRESPLWGFHEVQVVCRELGYPGALLKQRGGYGTAEGQASVHGFECYGNDKTLSDCRSNMPEKSTRRQKYSCGPRNEAVAICADPGYAGCFYQNDIHKANKNLRKGDKALHEKIDSYEMTIRMCREHCIMQSGTYKYAALYEGLECMCGMADLLTGIEPSPDYKCRNPCPGNEHEVCGGFNFFSVYDVTAGSCVDPYNQSNSYYYGDVVSATECQDVENDVYGSPDVQCIMGDSWNETKWSGAFPHCRDKLEGANKPAPSYTLITVWVTIGCFCLLAASVITAVKFIIGRTRMCEETKKTIKSTKSLRMKLPTKHEPRKSKTSSSPIYEEDELVPSKRPSSHFESIRDSIRNSIRLPFADHFYETTLDMRTNMLNFCTPKVKYHKAREKTTYHISRDPLSVSNNNDISKYQRTRELPPQPDNYDSLSRCGLPESDGCDTISRDGILDSDGYDTLSRDEIPESDDYDTLSRSELPESDEYDTLYRDPVPISVVCSHPVKNNHVKHFKIWSPKQSKENEKLLSSDVEQVEARHGDSSCSNDPSRAVFRTSDNDVVAYIVRTKL